LTPYVDWWEVLLIDSPSQTTAGVVTRTRQANHGHCRGILPSVVLCCSKWQAEEKKSNCRSINLLQIHRQK